MAKGAYLHLKKIGCSRLIACGLSESLDHVGLLERVEMSGQVYAAFRQIELGIDANRVVVRYMVGKSFRQYFVTFLQCDRALDRVLQFANVSMPRVILKKLHGLRR